MAGRPEPRARRAWIGALAAVLLLAAACSRQSGPAPDTLERAQWERKIRVGFANEAPYAYRDSASGRLTGEAPAIARDVLAKLGIHEIEGVLTEFGALIPGLNAGRFDIIAAGMYILPSRCAQIAFSDPTYSVGEAFIVARGNPLELHGYEDVARHPKARLGVVAGAAQGQYAQQLGVPGERVLVFPDPPSALEGVMAGRVDAYSATSLTVNSLLSRSGSRKVQRAKPFKDPVIMGRPVRGYGAFGFRKDDERLLAAFNGALTGYIGTPQHQEAVEPFGFTVAERPRGATARELCQG